MRSADEDAMRAALTEAALASSEGEIPIGAVVVDPDGVIVGRGHNEREAAADPTAHAEILALRRGAQARGEWRLDGCTLVVTLEPCPMCAGAALMSRVGRLVFGAWNDEYGAAGSRWDLVRDRRIGAPIEVVPGLLADECGAMVRTFLQSRRGVAE